MANPLTGDFEAVLQVSGGTINRLLASMHQNAGRDPTKPSFPHSVALRIGDDRSIDGVRGAVWTQVSVPRVQLIQGATDRFVLEVDIRARYIPDSGTTPLPEFINGTVRALYRLADVDPNCFGWRGIASDYIWPRVERDSVSFEGTANEDGNILEFHHGAAGEDSGLVTRTIAALLNTQFAAMPYKLEKGFRPGSLRSLNFGGESAVAAPIGISTPPVGRIDSIEQLVVDGNDFAFAISRDYVLSEIQGQLDSLRDNYAPEFRVITEVGIGPFSGKLDVTYRVRLTAATVDWVGGVGLNSGAVTVKVSGEAQTGEPDLNIGFDFTQTLSLTFDSGSQKITVGPLGSPVVHVGAGGLLGVVLDLFARSAIEDEVKRQAERALSQFDLEFNVADYTTGLGKQLKDLDSPQADASLEHATFGPDGVVLGGRIWLARREDPVAAFAKTVELDGYSAFESWIPGGRIDRFEWSWSWSAGAGSPGSDAAEDRFLLRRPRGGTRTKFGRTLGPVEPLPGLDGTGHICLNIRGVRVDPASGDLVPVETGLQCHRFGYGIPLRAQPEAPRLLLREYGDLRVPRPGPPHESTLVEVGGVAPGETGANTLVVYSDSPWDEASTATLREGLRSCRRDDAGLLVLALFPQGLPETWAADTWEELHRLADELEAPLLVNEDVRGAWSAALGFDPDRNELAWRLLSPSGGLSWARDGRASAEELTAALDGCLFPSGPPTSAYQPPGPDIGTYLSPSALNPEFDGISDRACPPPPLGRGIESLDVVFVQGDSHAWKGQLDRRARVRSEDERGASFVAVIVDGVGADVEKTKAADLERTRPEQGDRFATVVDSAGAIASRFEIRQWPMTVRVDDRGIVTAVEVGAAAIEELSGERA